MKKKHHSPHEHHYIHLKHFSNITTYITLILFHNSNLHHTQPHTHTTMTISPFSLTLLREIELAQTHQRECNRWADAYIRNCSAHEDHPHTRTPPPPRDTPPQPNTANGTANGGAGGRASSGRAPELCRWLKRQWERQCRVVGE